MQFRNDIEGGRYVLEDDGPDGPRAVAFTEYREADGRLLFPHTEVDPAHEGQGLAGQVVKGALDDVRAQGRLIVPLCPYVRRYVERHSEYADLVDHEMLAMYLDGQD